MATPTTMTTPTTKSIFINLNDSKGTVRVTIAAGTCRIQAPCTVTMSTIGTESPFSHSYIVTVSLTADGTFDIIVNGDGTAEISTDGGADFFTKLESRKRKRANSPGKNQSAEGPAAKRPRKSKAASPVAAPSPVTVSSPAPAPELDDEPKCTPAPDEECQQCFQKKKSVTRVPCVTKEDVAAGEEQYYDIMCNDCRIENANEAGQEIDLEPDTDDEEMVF